MEPKGAYFLPYFEETCFHDLRNVLRSALGSVLRSALRHVLGSVLRSVLRHVLGSVFRTHYFIVIVSINRGSP